MPFGEIYIKLAVNFANDPKVRALARFGAPDAGLARDLFVQMVCHCKEMLTDGFVSAEQVGLMVYPLDAEHGNQLAKQLASVGLIKEESKDEAPGWQVLAYVKRNGTREDVERLSQVRAEAGRKGGRPPGQTPRKANRNQVAKQNKSRPNPKTESETESETENQETPAVRSDVERLCAHLADRIEGNGANRPPITQDWRDAARLMIDRDQRTEAQIHAAIDWCQDDGFWKSNILSMPTLRKQYERLRLQAEEQKRGRTPPRGGSRQDDTDALFGRAAQRIAAREAQAIDPA